MLTVILLALALAATAVGALVLLSAWMERRVEALVPPLGRYVDIEGTRVHYVDVGSGPAIVLIHGLAGNLRNLSYDLLDALKDEYRVVFVDRPGSGYSERRGTASAALPVQAKAIAALIRKLDLEKPMLLGHSLGGALSLAIALDHPDMVGGLALVAPATYPQTEPPAPMAGLMIPSPFIRRIVAWTLATPLSMYRGQETIARVFHPDPVPADFGTRGGGFLGLRPKNFDAASADIVAVNPDLERMVPRYAALAMPVGILYGTGDAILDYRAHGERLSTTIPGCTLDLVEGQGHMLPISAPSRVKSLITNVASRMHRG